MRGTVHLIVLSSDCRYQSLDSFSFIESHENSSFILLFDQIGIQNESVVLSHSLLFKLTQLYDDFCC